MNKISVSTITPVYAGKNFLPELISKIEQVREKWLDDECPLELVEAIFVNDDSIDGSLEMLLDIQNSKSLIKVVNLSANFGQHQATSAGILHSSGDWVVTLDEDLQHDPLLIDTLLKFAVNSKLDIVYANPEQNVHESLLRDWTSRTFKRIVAFITGNRHVSEFNSFRLVRGAIARASASVCSHGTYFDIALCWFTKRISSIKLPLKDHRFIAGGESGYTFRKLFSHARRMMVSSETKVLRLGATFGLIAMSIAFIMGLYSFAAKIINPASIPIQGWTSLFLATLFFGGFISVLLGIVLEYISVILLHIQGKPAFFVVDRYSDRILQDYYERRETNDNS